jgi:hypothetical protein
LQKILILKRTLFIFFIVPISIFGQTVKYSNEFLNIGVDAAAFGMANAVTASTDDVNSVYWNPAGLTNLEDWQFSAMHASYFANIANYDYIAAAKPIDSRSAIGFSIIRFGVDDILNTTQLIDAQGNIDYNRISLFSTADYAFTMSYARSARMSDFSYGVNAKVIRRVIGEFANAWGFGFDVGVRYKKNRWELGAMARDITTTYNTWAIDEDAFSTIQNAVPGQNQELPEDTEVTLPKLQMGVAYNFEINRDIDLKTALNFNTRFAQTNDVFSNENLSMTPAFGFQADYMDIVYLRGGMGNFQNVEQLDGTTNVGFQPNFGIGFKYKGIQIDYAFTDIGDQSVGLYSNIFSIKVDWSMFRP